MFKFRTGSIWKPSLSEIYVSFFQRYFIHLKKFKKLKKNQKIIAAGRPLFLLCNYVISSVKIKNMRCKSQIYFLKIIFNDNKMSAFVLRI